MTDEGMQLGGYRLLSMIGHGGMGEVWLAEHALIGRRAAIKVLRPSISESEEVVTRFFNEARAAAAISDPGIVQIYDFGHHSDGKAFIVMELLDGETLADRLDRVGALPIADALRVIRQVASSLGAAHARAIVHRDLKPENIFIVRDPEVPGGERAKILDFGIAKLVDDPFAVKTHTSALLGTPMFMSPEQCRGAGQVDKRTDIYSLGCVLYTAIVGATPFEASGLGELLAMHMLQAPVRPSERRPGIPQAVEALIGKCMAKQPEHRFANGGELAAAIDAVLQRESAAAMHHASGTPQPAPARSFGQIVYEDTTLSASVGTFHHAAKPNRRRAAGIGAAALFVGGVVTWLALRGGNTEVARPAAAPPPAEALPQRTITPAPPSPVELAKQQIVATLGAFQGWAADHAGEPCPSHGELAMLVAGGVVDPWSHPLVITCTAQPVNQRIGVSSLGPDGIAGTPDDIASWNLGEDVVARVRGERWAPMRVQKPAKPQKPQPQPPSPSLAPAFTGTTLGDDGIPTKR